MPKNFKKKITVIILSYNRKKYLKRTVDYYLNENFKVLVLDGSENKTLFRKNINLKYIHTNKHYYDRLIIAYKNLKTDYYIIANDDEFYLPTPIYKCLNFLEKNKDYVSAIGRTIVFQFKYKKILAYEGYGYFNDQRFNDKIKINRIRAHLDNATTQGYNSVSRKENLKKIAIFLRKFKYKKNIYIIEFFLNLIIISEGRLKLINDLMWFRSEENKYITNKKWIRNVNHQHFFGDFKFLSYQKKNKQVEDFCKITNNKKLTKLILNKMINKSEKNFEIYTGKKNYTIFNSFLLLILKFKNNFEIFFNIIEFVKKNFLFERWYGSTIEKLIEKLSNKNIKVNSKEYNKIKKNIQIFYDK
tara:strand:+ start:304 stop:1377 length:1074 start_codon:yes stop_codon:yes gene_type:complete